ncbi:MAG: ABC transporter ATP-binding protein [Parcubacteria group bacterium]|jgi:ABC-type polysaccharide/polyol phosphate transport system ATPase subunit
MEKDIAIQVNNVSKTFRIPHEKISSLRGAFVSLPRRLYKKAGTLGSKDYEEFKALDDVSFEVKKGEFFGIIGRNGSGKSTLLKILAGIYQPDEGEIKVNGRISPFLELGIGFQPELSGRDNIYLNSAVLGLSPKQIEKKFDDIVSFSELGRFIDQKVKNYSSGMHVRLAFSVAIHANREILLMDEVLAVGDANFQSKCMAEFNKYKDAGKTVVLVTHDIATVQRYCDRAMLLRNGKIEMIGDPEKVGNEYVYQNMSDEEKRMLEEEKRQRIKAEKEAARIAQEHQIAEQRRKIDERRQQTEEEKRQQEEKKKMEKEKINKVAEITRVEFLDMDGKAKNVFKTGEGMSVRIYFKIHKAQNIFSFGFGLMNDENCYLMGINTLVDKIDVKNCIKRGYAQVDFANIPLRTGSYYIKFSIADGNYNFLYAALQRSQSFKVQSIKRMDGLIEMEYSWSTIK